MSKKKRARPTSPAQLAANRANAAASTGPRTPEGARAAALNATRHGILAAQIHFEDAEEENLYRTVWARLVAALKPTNMIESILVERIALTYWRLRRVVADESRAIAWRRRQAASSQATPEGAPPLAPPVLPYSQDLELLTRYEVTLERQFYRALDQLDRRRDDLLPNQRSAACLALLHESAEHPDPSRGAPPSSGATTAPLAAVPPSPAAPPPAPQLATPLVSRPSTPPSYPEGSSHTPTSWDEAIRALLSGRNPVVRGASSPSGSGARPERNEGRGAVLPNEPIPTPERERSP